MECQVLIYLVVITARKRSCGKVMFLQVSVILFTGGLPGPRGLPGPGGCLVLGGAWSLGVPGPRGVWSGGWVPGGDPLGRLLLRAVSIILECILVQEVMTFRVLTFWNLPEKDGEINQRHNFSN